MARGSVSTQRGISSWADRGLAEALACRRGLQREERVLLRRGPHGQVGSSHSSSRSSACCLERASRPESQRDYGGLGLHQARVWGEGWHRRQDSEGSRPGRVRHTEGFTAIIA